MSRSQPVVRVLMVCTGNICRSPTAEVVLRDLARAAGLGERLQVDSAGISDWHAGEPPDPRSQAHALMRGYDLSGLRARAVRAEDFERFDLLLAMDSSHLVELRRLCPPSRIGRLHLFLGVAGPARPVPDPYSGGTDDFEHVLDLVEQGCADWLGKIFRADAEPSPPILD